MVWIHQKEVRDPPLLIKCGRGEEFSSGMRKFREMNSRTWGRSDLQMKTAQVALKFRVLLKSSGIVVHS